MKHLYNYQHLFARMTPTDALEVFKDELTSRMTREQFAGQ
jgi:hypothetical protein